MTIKIIFDIAFLIAGITIGQIMLQFSDRIVIQRCEARNQPEKVEFINKWIIKRRNKFIVSFTNGILWAFVINFEESIILAVIVSMIMTLGLMISLIDLRIRLIPNELVLTLLVLGALYQMINFGLKSLLIAFACMIIIMSIFMILGAIMGFDKIGAGDVKLAGAMGVVLSYPNIFIGLFVMAIIILLFCLLGFSLYKLTLKSMFAYAPFMMSGMIVSLAIVVLNIDLIGGKLY